MTEDRYLTGLKAARDACSAYAEKCRAFAIGSKSPIGVFDHLAAATGAMECALEVNRMIIAAARAAGAV
jgi:hypothetical protein